MYMNCQDNLKIIKRFYHIHLTVVHCACIQTPLTGLFGLTRTQKKSKYSIQTLSYITFGFAGLTRIFLLDPIKPDHIYLIWVRVGSGQVSRVWGFLTPLHMTHLDSIMDLRRCWSASPFWIYYTTKPISSPTKYRALVGALQYLFITRPDISFAVNRLSQFMHTPTSLHWTTLKRLLRYLHGTLYHGILLRKNSPLKLHAFTDADWAGDKDIYRSTSGYIVYLGSNPISWSSKRQSTLTGSSTEAVF